MNFKYQVKLLFFLIITGLFSCTKSQIKKDDSTGTSNLKESTILNISYGKHTQQTYDIYLPAHRDSNTAAILLLHGGAWKAGDKADVNNYVTLIKNTWKNVAIANMNYRLASNANNIHHNEIMDDIKLVVSHLVNNKNNYNVSTKLGIMGTSAGGHLAMIYAYKYNYQNNIKCIGNIFGPSNLNDWSWYNSYNLWLGGKVGDFITEYVGQSWDTTVYKSVSPIWNISSQSQPTIIFHGNLDPIVPLYQSQHLSDKLNKSGVTRQYNEYVAFHGFDENQNIDVVNKLVAFFKTYLK
ncbi:MAG: alpha/beta hydrolase [Bacteroidetes bacterium]|nr:alpha/beta hydrolase [Bacteroidota bacterium]